MIIPLSRLGQYWKKISVNERAAWITSGVSLFIACITLIATWTRDSRPPPSPSTQYVVVTADSGRRVQRTLDVPSKSQFISKDELEVVNKSLYHIDTGSALAFMEPRGDGWEYGTVDRYDTITMLDIPSVGRFFFPEDQHRVSKVYAIREKTPIDLLITEESKVEGQYVNINPFANQDIQDKMIRNALEKATEWFDQQYPNISNEDRSAAHDRIKNRVVEQVRSLVLWSVQRMFPIHKSVYNGIYISRMSKEFLSMQLINKVLPRKDLFSMAVQYSIGSKGIGLENVKQVLIDSRDAIASYDCSVSLGVVSVNGYITNETVQNVGFIRVVGEEAILVNLVYINAGRDSSVYLDELLRVYNSLLFALYR